MFHFFGHSRRQPARSPRKSAHLSLEALEGRDLLAVGPILLAPLPAPSPSPGATPPVPAPGALPSYRSIIVNFEAIEEGPGLWTFQGQVIGQGVAGQPVQFGGLPGLKGHEATIARNGSFCLTIQLPLGLGGTATAQTTGSNVARAPVWSTE